MSAIAATKPRASYRRAWLDSAPEDSSAGIPKPAQVVEGSSIDDVPVLTWSVTPSFRAVETCVSSVQRELASDLQFANLFYVLDEMADLPEGFADAIDVETAGDANRVLGFIEASGVPAPKIFSHGGDAVVFSWDISSIRRYLTISGGDAAFLAVHKDSKIQCPSQIVALDTPAIGRWVDMLSANNSGAVKNARR
ncbi:hypothetical protein GGQ99_001354 [Aminobacter niigataensis]|uniref:Uncharacterized protein n=1 Tax=Aminobacter niigataensis TaxID=83265 RepID=A0ABR6KYS5_9HYPH|nr:hypothetical protein [Aminobacter niigataensis]MBB4649632.1 hypothetical protein [Aminobacter niigataensis]